MDEDTLRGLFLRRLRQRWESDPSQRERCELAARFGLAALEGKEAPRR